MTGFRDIKRKARRDLHQQAQVPAYYLTAPDAAAVLCHVRLHLTFGRVGDVKGARLYPAEMENDTPKIRFDLTEISAPKRGGIVSIEAGEAYKIDRMDPVDDEFQTAEVVRLTAAEASGLPIPDPGA
jgi:hypothetical protein